MDNGEESQGQMQLLDQLTGGMDHFYGVSDRLITAVEYLYEIFLKEVVSINPDCGLRCLSKRNDLIRHTTDQAT